MPEVPGDRCRVVVIDSGVDAHHPGVREPLEAHGGILVDGGSFGRSGPVEASGLGDRLGHGTWVTASIFAVAPRVEVVSLRVFDGTVVCSVEALCAALDAARGFAPEVVNLSVGTTSFERLEALRLSVDRLLASGARLVTPAAMSGLASYPGSFASVDAVVPDPNQPRTAPVRREVSGRSVWFASPKGPALERQPPPVCGGASLATAHVSGFLLANSVPRPR